MTPAASASLPTPAEQDAVPPNVLHAEIYQLLTVHSAATRLACDLAQQLTGEPFRQADRLARLLSGDLEPDDLPEPGEWR